MTNVDAWSASTTRVNRRGAGPGTRSRTADRTSIRFASVADVAGVRHAVFNRAGSVIAAASRSRSVTFSNRPAGRIGSSKVSTSTHADASNLGSLVRDHGPGSADTRSSFGEPPFARSVLPAASREGEASRGRNQTVRRRVDSSESVPPQICHHGRSVRVAMRIS